MPDAVEDILLEDGTDLQLEGTTTAIQLEWRLAAANSPSVALGVGAGSGIGLATTSSTALAIAGAADVAQINVATASSAALALDSVTPLVKIATVDSTALGIGALLPVGLATTSSSALAIADFRLVPGQPQNFEAERINSFQDTDLTWDEVSDADKYIITFAEHYRERYRKLTEITDSTTTTYTHNHGNADQRYSYRIYALHVDGAKSPNSPAVHTKAQTTER